MRWGIVGMLLVGILGLSATSVSAQTPPDRTSCNSIRGTDYRSDAERRWFLANCVAYNDEPDYNYLSGCRVWPSVSTAGPRQNTTVTVYGRLECGYTVFENGMRVYQNYDPEIPDSLRASWYYRTTTSECTARPTRDEYSDTLGCSRFISGATVGYQVDVEVCLHSWAGWHCGWTGFTPRP